LIRMKEGEEWKTAFRTRWVSCHAIWTHQCHRHWFNTIPPSVSSGP